MKHEQSEELEPDAHEEIDAPGGVEPQIWVGSLSDYNNGILHGEWLDAARDVDEIQADIQTMLDRSPTAAQTGLSAEEWGIFDNDGFGRLRVDEHEDLEIVSRIAKGVAEHGLAYAAYADVVDADRDAMGGFEDDYLGHYDSVEAYVEELVDDVGYERMLDEAVPESFRPYVRIDVDQLAHDMEIGGDIHVLPADGGGVWIFRVTEQAFPNGVEFTTSAENLQRLAYTDRISRRPIP
jgi:antirestriction protein